MRTLILTTASVIVFAATSANSGPEVSFDFALFSVTSDAPVPDGYADAITDMLVPPPIGRSSACRTTTLGMPRHI
jgi:hypothetical protein